MKQRSSYLLERDFIRQIIRKPPFDEMFSGLLSYLTEAQREVVTLFYRKEKTLKEIAEITGKDGSTVSRHLTAADKVIKAVFLPLRNTEGEKNG